MGGCKRFVMNPFPSMELSSGDNIHLKKTATAFLMESVHSYETDLKATECRVDERCWKPIKTRENMKLYLEREVRTTTEGNCSMMNEASEQAGTPVALCVGTMQGNIDDVVFGTVSATSEDMCHNSTYVDNLTGAAVLATVLEPTKKDPLQTLALKWQELNLPMHSCKRDFVFIEATGFTHLANGERVGYRLMYSIGFPQTPELPERVRGIVNAFFICRQKHDKCVEVYAAGVVANGSAVESLLVTPSAMKFLTCLKFAHCGEMKKLTWLMQQRYTLNKQQHTTNVVDEGTCVNCGIPISPRLFGKFGRSRDSCKLCHRLVCGTCCVKKRLHCVTLAMTFEERKTAFCPSCIKEAFELDPAEAARAQVAGSKLHTLQNFAVQSATNCSFASSSHSERTV